MILKTHHFSFDGSFPKSKYCDVKLSTLDGAGRDIAAHKVVLAAVSAKVEKLIDRAGEGVGPVTVRNIRFEILEKIVEFIYSGRVEIEDADIEDFQDGLDMLRIRLNKQLDHNETLRSINVPVSEVGNVPRNSFLPTPSYDDDPVKVPNNLAVLNNPRTVFNSSAEAVPNITENVQGISNSQDGFVDVLHQSESLLQQIIFDSHDARSRSRLSSLSSSDSNSENVPHNSTPRINIPETFSFISPAVSNISVAVRKPRKYRSQEESDAGDSDGESVTSPIMKGFNPCYDDRSEVSSAESITEPEKDDPPSLDHNKNNIQIGDSIKRDVPNPKSYVIRCPLCEVQMSYGSFGKHCKKKHSKVLKSSEKVVCNVCRQSIPSYCYELHLQSYHLQDAEKGRLGRDDLGMAGSSKIMEKDNSRRFHEAFKNSEKEKMNHSYKSVVTVTKMSQDLKRRLEEVGNDRLKCQKMETEGQLLSGRPGRYDAFIEDVSEEGVGSKYRKVRCLLCGDGKLHCKKNIASHVKAMHELYVKCPSCGKEFNREQMKRHNKLCPSKNAQVSQEMKSKNKVFHGKILTMG